MAKKAMTKNRLSVWTNEGFLDMVFSEQLTVEELQDAYPAYFPDAGTIPASKMVLVEHYRTLLSRDGFDLSDKAPWQGSEPTLEDVLEMLNAQGAAMEAKMRALIEEQHDTRDMSEEEIARLAKMVAGQMIAETTKIPPVDGEKEKLRQQVEDLQAKLEARDADHDAPKPPPTPAPEPPAETANNGNGEDDGQGGAMTEEEVEEEPVDNRNFLQRLLDRVDI